jgi:hypothetical protein
VEQQLDGDYADPNRSLSPLGGLPLRTASSRDSPGSHTCLPSDRQAQTPSHLENGLGLFSSLFYDGRKVGRFRKLDEPTFIGE